MATQKGLPTLSSFAPLFHLWWVSVLNDTAAHVRVNGRVPSCANGMRHISIQILDVMEEKEKDEKVAKPWNREWSRESKKGKEKIMGRIKGKDVFSPIINVPRRLNSFKMVIGKKPDEKCFDNWNPVLCMLFHAGFCQLSQPASGQAGLQLVKEPVSEPGRPGPQSHTALHSSVRQTQPGKEPWTGQTVQ